jgi:hypothetical protein
VAYPAGHHDLIRCLRHRNQRLCVELDRIEHGTAPTGDNCQADAQSEGSPSREALRQAIIGKAVDLLSGPGGLASFLRTRQLGARLAGPSRYAQGYLGDGACGSKRGEQRCGKYKGQGRAP